MAQSTNLAARPFRNERLPWLLAGLLLAASVVITVVHARFIARLWSGSEANTVRLVREDERRIAALEQNVAKEPPLRLEAVELSRLRAYKELVDRRVFPWRLLLSDLEEVLSENVRLTSISPVPTKSLSGVAITLLGEARTKDAAFSFAETLDASTAFSQTVLKSLSEEDGKVAFVIEALFDLENATADTSKAAEGLPRPVASPLPATSPVRSVP